MNADSFFDMSESLRLYRRAEIKPKAKNNKNPIDNLYVDPLNNNAILKSILSDNTVFLLGRKGTGKSTVFSKAESALKDSKDLISVYVDVKSLYDVVSVNDYSDSSHVDNEVSFDVYKMHQARKEILNQILTKLISTFKDKLSGLSIIDSITGRKKRVSQGIEKLDEVRSGIGDHSIEHLVLPTLRKITTKITSNQQSENSSTEALAGSAAVKGKLSLGSKGNSASFESSANGSVNLSDFQKVLNGTDLYNEYSDTFVRSYPFQKIISSIQEILDELGMSKLFIFLDDFSEIELIDQRLFVDVILSTLNNSSNEYIKLKIAAYPGRVYYGKLDPAKCTISHLDFYDLYESNETQEMERKACHYTKELIERRFDYYDLNVDDYFDVSSTTNIESYYYQLFKASFNAPRIIGNIFHTLYKDRISQGFKINPSSIDLAARKYYENITLSHFDLLSRFALEPFDNKIDRHNQKELVSFIIDLAKDNKSKIKKGTVGGDFFDGLRVIPTSHFHIKEELSSIFSSLEANYLISRYKKIRNKTTETVYVYALSYGLCVYEKIDWGYPDGRKYRAYFQQRCFDYSSRIHQFLSTKSCLKCTNCQHVMRDDEKNKTILEVFEYLCPNCRKSKMVKQNIVSEELDSLMGKLNGSLLLEPVELSILSVLHQNEGPLSASDIAGTLDTNRQLIGKRTAKLQEQGLVDKDKESVINKTMNALTDRARQLYFS